MEENNSEFFKEVKAAIEAAKEKHTDEDNILMLLTDKKSCVTLVSGDTSVLLFELIKLMRKNPDMARTICHAAVEFQLELMQQPVLRIPPLPKDGIADWPQQGIILGIDKGSEEKGS